MKKNKYKRTPRKRKSILNILFSRSFHIRLASQKGRFISRSIKAINCTKVGSKKHSVRGTNPGFKFSTERHFGKAGKFSLKRAAGRIRNVFINFFKFPTIPKLLLFAVICLFGYLIYKVDQISYFNVKKLQISGNEQTQEISIREECEYVLGKNIFTLSVNQIEEVLKNVSIYIKEVHVEKVLPDILMISIDEREPMSVWRSVNGAYLVDKEGFILEKVVNNEINLQAIQDSLLNSASEEEIPEQFSLAEEDISQNEEDKQAEENAQQVSINLDEDMIKQIDWELKQREKEINLFRINFDEYLQLPDSFKKYPQVKVWSDEIFDIGTFTNTEILERYLLLINELNNYTFEIGETIIFSENKVLVNFKEGFKVYFKLDSEISQQVMKLNFIYSRLRLEGITFQEIDLRFKRPVVRE